MTHRKSDIESGELESEIGKCHDIKKAFRTFCVPTKLGIWQLREE